MRLRLVTVPDSLWADRSLPEGAKLIWCYMQALVHVRTEFTPKEIALTTGVSLPSLHRYLHALELLGWLVVDRVGLRRLDCEVHTRDEGPHLILPSDLLFDRRLPRGACWVWGAIGRAGGQFDYGTLAQLTGYSRETVASCTGALIDSGYLVGGSSRIARQTIHRYRGANPHAVRRALEVQDLSNGLRVAKETPGYSQGQYILARLIKLMSPGINISENAELTGLDNAETGGRMHCDILLPDQKLAIEYHGNQHAGPTDLYPSVEQFRSLRQRDLLKRGLLQELGLDLVVIWAWELGRARIREVLGHRIPFVDDLSGQWHLVDFLDRQAERIRRAAARKR